MSRILTGHLEYVPHDAYYFILDDTPIPDDFEIVRFEDGKTPEIVPLMKYMELVVDDEQYIQSWKILAEAEPMPLLADQVEYIRLGIFLFTDLNTTPEETLKKQKKVDDAARDVENYIRYYGQKRVDIEVRGFVVEYEGYCTPPYYAKDAINKFIEDNGIDWDFTHYHGWEGKSTRRVCGLGTLDGNRSATYRLYACGVRTIIHEVFHNLGLLHCGQFDRNGLETEYGDITSLMGSMQQVIEGHVSQHMLYKGWLHPTKVMVVKENKRVLLDPVELPHTAIHDGVYQHVIIREAGQPDYALSMRKDKGTLYPQSDGEGNRIYVHRVDENGKATKKMASLSPMKQELTLPSGTIVRWLGYQSESGMAEIRFAGDDTPTTPIKFPVGFPPPPPLMESKVFMIDAGAYHNEVCVGQGFDIFVRMTSKGKQVVMSWYTYSQTTPTLQVWYTANGLVKTDEFGNEWAELVAYSNLGGTWDDPSTNEEFAVGTMQVYFDYENRAYINWDFMDIYGRGGTVATPVVKMANNDRDGFWYQPDKNGSGFGLRFTKEKEPESQLEVDIVSGFWYTYDQRGRRIWLVLKGTNTTGSYRIKIYKTTGAEWQYPQAPVEAEVGSGVLRPDMSLSYSVDFDGILDSGTLFLERA